MNASVQFTEEGAIRQIGAVPGPVRKIVDHTRETYPGGIRTVKQGRTMGAVGYERETIALADRDIDDGAFGRHNYLSVC